MPDAYDYISLMCRLKAAQTRNKELESGEHYIKLKELHQKECRAYERKIQALLTEIADAHKETIRVRSLPDRPVGKELFSSKGKTNSWKYSTGICTGNHIQSQIFRRWRYGVS